MSVGCWGGCTCAEMDGWECWVLRWLCVRRDGWECGVLDDSVGCWVEVFGAG